MTVVQELFETYDPLEKAPTLTLYMLKDGEEWARISSDEPVIGTQLTRWLQMSQDSRPILKRLVSNGERLTYHVKKQGSPWKAYNIVPSDWVVTKVVQYEPFDLGELPEFRGVNYPTARSRGLSVALIWSARLQDNTEPLGLFTAPPTSSITFEPFSSASQ